MRHSTQPPSSIDPDGVTAGYLLLLPPPSLLLPPSLCNICVGLPRLLLLLLEPHRRIMCVSILGLAAEDLHLDTYYLSIYHQHRYDRLIIEEETSRR